MKNNIICRIYARYMMWKVHYTTRYNKVSGYIIYFPKRRRYKHKCMREDGEGQWVSSALVLTKHVVSVKINSCLNRFTVQHFNYAVLMSLYRNLSAALFCSLRFIKSSGRCPTALQHLFCAVSQSVAIAFFAYYTFESKMYGVFLSYGRFSVQ